MQPNPALASNAGDRYHFVYVGRKLLNLLYPRSALVRVEVEGVAEEDAGEESAAKLLGVDLTEYSGGDSAATASRVEVGQVKYSPTHPDEAWTSGRLRKLSTKNPRSSVIGRLAEAYETMVPLIGAATVLRAKLVSNQPLDPDLRSDLDHFYQTTGGLDVDTAVERARADSPCGFLVQLQEASGLDWPTFVSFLRVLDLELGASSLTAAETHLFQGLNQLINQADILVGYLIAEVQRAATPGQQRTFRKQDVYALLASTKVTFCLRPRRSKHPRSSLPPTTFTGLPMRSSGLTPARSSCMVLVASGKPAPCKSSRGTTRRRSRWSSTTASPVAPDCKRAKSGFR
jgi:hypothetical protein